MTASQPHRTLDRGRQRQGRRRQIDGRRQSRDRAGAVRQEGRAGRRRRLRARRSRPCSARDAKPTAENDQLIPVEAQGLKFLSLGQLVSPGHALAWRGPMATGALAQLIEADWGDTELLVVDLPPGHRRRAAVADPEVAAGRGGDRFDPAGPVADRCHAGDRPVPQDGRAGARDHREYGGLRLPALRRGLRSVRERRRGSGGQGAGRAVPRPPAAVAGNPGGVRRRQSAGGRRRQRSEGLRRACRNVSAERWKRFAAEALERQEDPNAADQ